MLASSLTISPLQADSPAPTGTPLHGETARSLRASLEQTALPDAQRRALADILRYAEEAEARIAEQQAEIRHLHSLSTTDDLTGLLNRRGFHEALTRTLSAARRHDERGLLALLDLDRFKPINDAHGHEAGDAVLRAVAGLLAEAVRQTDYVGRLGGDEFAILMVRAEPLQGRARLLHLARDVAALEVSYNGTALTVGASIGIEAYGASSTAADLMARADQAMYRSKTRRAACRT